MDNSTIFQPQQTPPPPNLPPSGGMGISPFGNLLKIVIGIVIVLLVIAVIGFLITILFFGNTKKVTLTYWGLWEDKAVFTSIINDFQKKYPNITIDYKKESLKLYIDRLKTRIPKGSGPDIFRFHNTWVSQLQNELLPLSTEVITPDEFKTNFYPVAQDDLVRNGAIYGIPLEIDTLALFVNTEILQAGGYSVPDNWNDLKQIARQITTGESTIGIQTAGVALGTYTNITHAPDIISLLFLQNNVNPSKICATPQTTQNAADALKFYIDFVKEPPPTWDESLEPSILAFAKGNVGMYIGYSWDIFVIKAVNPNLAFSVHPVPKPQGGKRTTVASYWVEGISAKSTHKKEAYLFLHFLAQKETEQKFFDAVAKTRLFGEPYARVDLAESLKDNVLVYPFVSQAKDAKSTYFSSDTQDGDPSKPGAAGVNTKVNIALQNAVQSVHNGTSAQSAIEELCKQTSGPTSQ